MRKFCLAFLCSVCLYHLTSAQGSITAGNDTSICFPGTAMLIATVTSGSYGTDSYTFEQISYNPEPFVGGTPVDPSYTYCENSYHDDCYGGPFPIGFSFCFFNQQYTQFWVGSNGWIGFTDPNTYGTQHNWVSWSPGQLPMPNAPVNCIFSPWEDWYPNNNSLSFTYYYTTGVAPNRKLVVYWKNVPTFSCPTILGTFEIVINEQNSIIENHLQNKPICNAGSPIATQGVQNADGTVAFIVPGRNQSVWSATNESTRFVPSGITWYTGGYPGGTVAGYGDTVYMSPADTTVYTAVLKLCDGTTATDNVAVNVVNPTFAYALNAYCQSDPDPTPTVHNPGGFFSASPSGLVFLNVVTGTIDLSASTPGTYSVTYTTTPFACSQSQTLTVNSIPAAPIAVTPFVTRCGPGNVTFSVSVPAGQTVNWYDAPTGGNLLPLAGQTITTNVVASTHFYAEAKDVTSNCTSLTRTDISVTVFPIPVITNTILGSSACNGDTAKILPASSVPGSTFTWTATGSSPSVSGFSNGSGLSIAQRLFNSGSTIETVSYSVTAIANGCPSNPVVFVVTVYPVVTVSFSPTAQTVCSGVSCNISLSCSLAGGTFSWVATGSSPSISGYAPGTGGVINQTLLNSGLVPGTVTYTVTPAISGCPGTQASVIVTVNPLPTVTFNSCYDPVTTTDAQPFPLKGGIPVGGTYSGPGVTGGVFTPSAAGAGIKTLTYTSTNYLGCSKSATSTITVQSPAFFSCGNALTDIRDGKSYATILIGSQCWMAVNLDYGTYLASNSHQLDNCSPEKYCYNDILASCTSQGGLYQWDEIMTYRGASGIQGLCPPAWHIPTEAEWVTLFSNYTNNGFAASALKFTGYSGFNGLLSGVDHFNLVMNWSGFATMFWTSDAHGPYKAWAHGMNSYDPSVSFYPSFRENAFSVRCLKD